MKNRSFFYLGCCVVLFFSSCNSGKEIKEEPPKPILKKEISVPSFNNDSSYYFVEKQVSFGPRIPNTRPHIQTGDFIISELNRFGWEVEEQQFQQETWDGELLYLRNIIASWNPQASKRILLAAHWDTRPYADKDQEDPNAQFEGANDGASGVGVLLEVARTISSSSNQPEVGIDIIFFDGEDWGERIGESKRTPRGLDSWWCLGSQYWSNNKHKGNYSAYYGILLDMVGAKDAMFVREGLSMKFAPKVVKNVWDIGNALGYGRFFSYQKSGPITDDHEFVNRIGKIPMINIVHYDNSAGYFGDFHHSRKDNLTLIDKNTLGAVGETVLHVIYYE